MVRKFLLLVMVVSLVLVAQPVSAGSPWEAVEIEVWISYPPGDEPQGPFFAEGDAVTAGLICATGATIDVESSHHGPPSGLITNSIIVKEFTCEDGTFLIRSNIHNNQIRGFELVRWDVVGGTGAYADLRGRGTSIGLGGNPGDPEGSTEVFTGWLR